MKTFKKPLSYEEEAYFLSRVKQGDTDARNLLVEYNLRLVAHIVKKYSTPYYDTEDLISIGTIGLIKAINTYDMEKGSRLATYAARCIENELLMKFRQEKKLARETSLYEPIGTDKEGNEISLMDVIGSEEDCTLSGLIQNEQLTQLSRLLPDVLEPRELQVITLRYGLGGTRELTQREVANLLHISRSYVSRIEKKALLKLRSALF
jgi:RNA polymerase sporulation-specific sigma factor